MLNILQRHRFAVAWYALIISVVLTTAISYLTVRMHDITRNSSRDISALQQLLDDAETMIAAADVDSGLSVFQNRSLVEATGWTTASLNTIGGVRNQFSNPLQWDRLVSYVKEGKAFDEIATIHRAKGGTTTFRMRSLPLIQSNGHGILIFVCTADQKGD